MDRSLAVGLGLCGLDRFAGGNPNKKDKKKEDVSTDQQNNASYKLTIPERDLILQKICQVTTDNNHGSSCDKSLTVEGRFSQWMLSFFSRPCLKAAQIYGKSSANNAAH